MKDLDQIRELRVTYEHPRYPLPPVRQPADFENWARAYIGEGASQEHFVAAYLDARHRIIASKLVSVGTATASLVHAREVYQGALIVGACAVLIAHNHPSGEAIPSDEDRNVTKRLAEAGRVVGVKLLDHIVIGAAPWFCSIRSRHPECLDGGA